MNCLNLESRFPAYRIRMSLDHEHGQHRDPWNFEIPCSRFKARIYPHGGTKLQAWIQARRIGETLRRLEAAGASPWQVGDAEATVLFEASDFDRIAVVLKPIKRPRAGGKPFPRKDAPKGTSGDQTEGFEPKVGYEPQRDEK